MDTSTKNVIIGCFLTAALSIPLTALGTNAYNIKHAQEQNQNVTLNINGEEVSLQAHDIEELHNRISELESENQMLLNQLEQSHDGDSNAALTDNVSTQQPQDDIIYLNEFPVFNCQYLDGHSSWHASNIPEWNVHEDKAANGETYDHAVHMTISEQYIYLKTYRIDYLLESKYKIFNGSFMLDERSKSTPSNVTLKIYGDDILLYECSNITGGFVPQNTGNLSIETVRKLTFEFSSDYADLRVNDGYNFGVVFYNTVLN